jgi:hypothetical protein
MNKLNVVVQSVCLVLQTFGFAIGLIFSNYLLSAWCAIFMYYAINQIVKEVDKCHISTENSDQH